MPSEFTHSSCYHDAGRLLRRVQPHILNERNEEKMAFYYGKIEPETYEEIKRLNKLRRFALDLNTAYAECDVNAITKAIRFGRECFSDCANHNEVVTMETFSNSNLIMIITVHRTETDEVCKLLV